LDLWDTALVTWISSKWHKSASDFASCQGARRKEYLGYFDAFIYVIYVSGRKPRGGARITSSVAEALLWQVRGGFDQPTAKGDEGMQITSPAFEHDGKIPSQYTCEGSNTSPPLRFADIPQDAASLVLLMDDPDVPKNIRDDGIWDHWIVYNISPDVRETAEGDEPPGRHGIGTAGNRGYYGPCPPDREHRYYFTLYALDTQLDLKQEPTKAEVIAAMEGHIIDRATLMGRYEKHS
jgi:hypothetical protein